MNRANGAGIGDYIGLNQCKTVSREGKGFIFYVFIFKMCINQSDLSFQLAMTHQRDVVFVTQARSRHLTQNIHKTKICCEMIGNNYIDLFSIKFDF